MVSGTNSGVWRIRFRQYFQSHLHRQRLANAWYESNQSHCPYPRRKQGYVKFCFRILWIIV